MKTPKNREPIAIIGIGCRFPGGANNPEAFWRLLQNGVDAIAQVPANRWNLSNFYDPDPAKPGKIRTRWGGFIEDIDKFDAQFFGISPREASCIDPQQRLLLEVVWEALEDGGQVSESLAGSNTGVFIGISGSDYHHIQLNVSDRNSINAYTHLGGVHCIAANRISYILNLKGPSMAVDTACSSSLVAVHLACQSIWNGESALAIAGGVNAILKPETTIGFSKASMLSPDGRCFTFDARANGYVRAEGAGIVVLKPLSQAQADRDPIYAVIRATAVNQDGQTNGITVPNGQAQEAAIREACRQAGVLPEQLQYIEAHGTGTPVGDPIETNALGNVLGKNRPSGNYCVIGSVKTNIGHLESASGIAGLVKVALALKHGQIPPNLHFQTPNPQIPFEELRLRVATALEPWPNANELRIAGINSFGFGGTNAHAVLTEVPVNLTNSEINPKLFLLPLSARSQEALQDLAAAYKEFLTTSDRSLLDICYSASLRRVHHERRLAVVASPAELTANLEAFLAQETRLGMSAGRVVAHKSKLAFVFSGMGQQWWAMGRTLLEEEPVFRETIQRCDKLLGQYTDWSLWAELTASEENSRINETQIAQCAIFSVQVALAALWRNWGIIPEAIVGHSVGEVAAAHVAGVLSLEDAVRVIFHRSRLQATTAGQGKMLAVGLSLEQAEKVLAEYQERVSMGVVNSPSSVTLSGDSKALEEIAHSLELQEIFCRFLKVEVPYHSPLMEPLKAKLAQSLQEITPQKAVIPLFSTVTGQQVAGTEMDGAYWGQNIRNPVLFATAVAELMQAKYNLFLEIGAHPVLANYILEVNQTATVLPCLRRKELEQVMLLGSFGKLYTLGYPVDWHRLYPQGEFVRLPSYPWQGDRYWHESEESQQARLGQTYLRNMLGRPVHALLGSRLESVQPLWNAAIDKATLTYLDDHRIQGSVVYPGAAYVEMALAAAKEIFGEGRYVLEDIEFVQALFLADEPVTVQLSVERQGQTSFEIHSLVKGEQMSWMRHATGNLLKLQTNIPDAVGLDKIRRRCPSEISKNLLYQQFQDMGLEYGSNFQGIEQLWGGEKEAIAQIKLPEALAPEVKDYQLHPAILDACFQVLIGAVSDKNTYLPTRIERLRIYERPGLQVWSHARLVAQNTKQIHGDIHLLDEAGNVLVEIQGFCCQSLGKAQEGVAKQDGYLYEYQWELQPRLGQTLISQPANYLSSPHQIAASLQSEAARLSKQLGRKHYYETVNPQVDVLSAAYILQALRQLGWQPQLLTRISTNSLAEQLGVVPQHRRLLGRMLEILEQEGVLQLVDDQWQVRHPEFKAPQEIWQGLFAQFPAYQAELMLHRRCGEKLTLVLRGEVDPLQLIFPEGSLTASEQLYQDSPNYRIYNLLVQKAIALALERLPKGRKLRILEIGAGTGSMTSYVLPKLPAKQTEYVFTDVTQVFVTSAQQKFSDYPFIECLVLDIEADPVSQGFDAHTFDVILASDVLHATRDLRSTLENIKQLLASEGLLVFIELTNAPYWSDLVFGMLKGWWLFSDLDLRSLNPLLSAPKWRDLLSQVGFAEVDGISDTDGTFEPVHTVFLAQGPQVQPETLPEFAIPLQPQQPGTWLIFSDRFGIGQQLAEKLKQYSQTPIFILPGDDYQHLDADFFQIRPEHPEDMQQLLEAVSTSQPALSGVIHLWSLDIPPAEETTVVSLEQAQKLGCLCVLHLVQALERVGSYPRLVLVTTGVQALGEETGGETQHPVVSVAQSPLWGLGRVINNEFPNLQCVRVDISSTKNFEEIDSLFAELWSDEREDEIALRGKARYVHRLVRIQAAEINSKSQIRNQPFRLETTQPGILDNLTLRQLERQKPGMGEVEIEVYATGLNFKDVAKAMNLLADANLEGNFSGRSLGLECAGKITAIGSGVAEFQIGDEVIASAPHSFSTHTITDARLVVRKPAHLSFEEAATIPAVFLTAYYALHYLGRISKGDRVLIHAAAGGVGLAAIQLAQKAGAEIFATAGSPEKREFLQAIGVEHVMDSRSLAFAEQVMECTDGKGVDIVLNSLAGAAIAKSLSVLGAYGRFIEIGKRDIDENSKLGLRPFQNNLSFFAVDLDRLWRERPEFAGSLFGEVMKLFEERTLHPLPHRVFPISQVQSAFRYMAQAKHIGKIIVSLQESDVMVVPATEEKVTFPSDGTYLITGGLGGFSLAVAKWLVENGARHLVLMGRSGVASPAAQSAIATLAAAGAKVVVAKADVSQADQVANVLTDIKQSMPPLRGIFHAALVLDDAVLLQLNPERFFKVTSPKIIGAWNLHAQTLNAPLDCFVLFSSVAATIGNPGQGNYVAASAFLDALAHHRHTLQLPALTVNWGVIADVGYVAQNPQIGEHFQRLGLKPLQSQQALKILGELLRTEAVQTAVAPVDWQQWHQAYPAGTSPRFSYLTSKAAVSQAASNSNSEVDSLYNTLLAVEPAERQQLLESRLLEQVARVLGTSAAKLDNSKPLTSLGLDSLMAVELSNRIKNEMDAKVPAMKLMQGLSISQLTTELIEQLTGTSAANAVNSQQSNSSVTVVADWLVFPKPNPNARLRLFCLPYIGGSSSTFRDWSKQLPSEIEVCAVQLPGGADRLSEEPFKALNLLVETLASVMLPNLDKPFAFYGHSLGATIAFELARYLRREIGKIPVHLFVAALQAPQLPHPYPCVTQLSDSEALEKASLLDFPESFWQNRNLMRLLLPSLKAGILISQNYTYSQQEPLDCPISAFGGVQDKVITQEHLQAWRNQTCSTFKLQIFPGNHLFLHSDQNLLLSAISQDIKGIGD
ncbi:SDR family NAD(P)-dependent oxidoreductase [Dendronalium sp. ChiSLP03b]|uniref:SDR family NAD(P)-dependent oxidoreductase n=1 Tax=Dendronalium sp. ChiSLP03b TaxID=3075381 RepID=UPI002AD3F9B4|nr:SDR family NAD(P)-dependent oxidoreductase [Dendronalium sp. ChiSLP03b]MDZ8205890.1 SDR family NAD(P)-dependent oxidoreductase [Dendronalium sp. ChiSLP03b]